MPLYVYACSKCGNEFEHIVGYGKRKETQACPKCKEEAGEYVDRIHNTNYSQNRQFSRMRLGK